jgi:hypothetical protein
VQEVGQPTQASSLPRIGARLAFGVIADENLAEGRVEAFDVAAERLPRLEIKTHPEVSRLGGNCTPIAITNDLIRGGAGLNRQPGGLRRQAESLEVDLIGQLATLSAMRRDTWPVGATPVARRAPWRPFYAPGRVLHAWTRWPGAYAARPVAVILQVLLHDLAIPRPVGSARDAAGGILKM